MIYIKGFLLGLGRALNVICDLMVAVAIVIAIPFVIIGGAIYTATEKIK